MAGQLYVSSSAGTVNFNHDQINIESSVWVIGGALNALRGLGDAIGAGFNYVFNSSARDKAAQADLGSIKAGAGVTRVTGADVLTFGNGALLVASGGGNVLAIRPSNLVASGGGNLVASGGGNLLPGSTALFVDNNTGLLAKTGLQLLSQDRGGIISTKLITQDGGGLIPLNVAALLAGKGNTLISQDGGSLVASGGGNVVERPGR